MAYGKRGSPGTPTPDWDKDWPPKAPQKPKPKPKLAKKPTKKKPLSDPERPYYKQLPGAPAGWNRAQVGRKTNDPNV